MIKRTIVCLVLVTTLALLIDVDSACGGMIRLMNWNVANHPNDDLDRSDFQTAVSYLGQSRPFDILSLAESDTGSAVDITSITNSVYGSTSYTSVLSAANAGGDRTQLLYNSSTLQLLNSFELNNPTFTQNMLRGQFRPIGTTGQSDFFVYSIHLKSGATIADRAARSAEAQLLRSDIDALGSAAVILAGDFNWATSTETGTGTGQSESPYQVFSAPGQGQVTDPVGQVGSWRDNPTYLSLHTNDPGLSMNDRFDMQLVSSELSDGLGLDYIPGSYFVLGNNGTHLLNGAITTGTGAPANVLASLSRFSDHLPVIADYSFTITAIPEPQSFMLIAVAGIGFFLRLSGQFTKRKNPVQPGQVIVRGTCEMNRGR